MKEPRKQSTLARWRWTYRGWFDAFSMLIYVSFVYAWGLGTHPLGRDYAVLAHSGEGLPFVAGALFSWEMRIFGAWATGYQLVNLALLYVCMLCIYNLLNRTVKGVFWLGTLGAVLFMANPVHTESALNVSGLGDVIPCVFALLSLTAYACLLEKTNGIRVLVAVVLFALAVLPYRENAFLFGVVILLELLICEPGKRRYIRLVPFVVIGIAGLVLHGAALGTTGFHPARMWAPLYLVFYPIGLLPDTARTLCERPWLGWIGAAGVLLVVTLIYRKARRPAILFGLLGMVVVRLFQGTRPVDPVHMVGGGQLLLANALFVIGLVALFFRMMDHPRWRVTIVGFTTFLCVVFFVLQIRENLAWRQAGRWVEQFQQDAEALNPSPAQPLAVCPDYRYYQGAPVCLSESLQYDTLFSKALPVVPVLPLHADKPERMKVLLTEWSPEAGTVVVEGKRPLDVAPWPYTLSRVGREDRSGAAVVQLSAEREGAFALSILPKEGETLPSSVFPAQP